MIEVTIIKLGVRRVEGLRRLSKSIIDYIIGKFQFDFSNKYPFPRLLNGEP